MDLFIFAVLGFFLVGGGLLSVIISTRWLSSDQVTKRLSDIVKDEISTEVSGLSVSAQTRDIQGSIINRVMTPIMRQFGNLIGRFTPNRSLESLRHQLTIAGNPYGLGPREFFGLRVLFFLVGAVASVLIFRRGLDSINIMAGFAMLAIGFLLPVIWLRGRVNKRQDRIRKGLPDALDMLTVCASAGLGFDQAMQRVSEHWNTPIGLEFARVISEMEMGLSRREALRNMADRLDILELSSFVSFLLQSEQLGMSISDTLHAQADQMRIERRFRAQEQAQKIPTKMLFPMVFLIFPALLAIVLGPSLPRLMNIFSGF